jgi:hypothetical protein
MKNIGLILVSVTLFAIGDPCLSQIVNGDFSSGTSGWSWKQAAIAGDVGDGCATSLQTYSAVPRLDTPGDSYVSSLGRFAKVSGNPIAGVNPQTFCRQIEQSVYLPPGSVLKFDRELARGNLINNQFSAEDVYLKVTGFEPVSGVEKVFYSGTGRDFYCWPTIPDCRPFLHTEADVSAFWGKTVQLRFRAFERRLTINGLTPNETGAYVDNIRLEQIPIAPWAFSSGSWYNPNRGGHGIHLSRAGNGSFVVIWYTYLADGRSVWYISDTKPAVNGVWQGTLYKSSWNSSTGTDSLLPAGDIKIEMTGQRAMTFYWDLYSVNGNNTGFDGAEPFVFLSGGGSYTGLWYEPSYSGWGLSLEYLDNPAGIDTVATAFYYAGSEPVWSQGAVEGTPTGNKLIQLTEYTGIGLCPECIGQQTQMWPWPAGMLSLDLDAQRGWIDAQSHSGFPWNRGSSSQPAEIVRMTGP